MEWQYFGHGLNGIWLSKLLLTCCRLPDIYFGFLFLLYTVHFFSQIGLRLHIASTERTLFCIFAYGYLINKLSFSIPFSFKYSCKDVITVVFFLESGLYLKFLRTPAYWKLNGTEIVIFSKLCIHVMYQYSSIFFWRFYSNFISIIHLYFSDFKIVQTTHIL